MNPTSILQIEPTTRCNFKCRFCVGRHLPKQDMNFSVFEQIIDSVQDVVEIMLYGDGEPLLYPKYFDMVDAIKKRHPRCKIHFFTNGSQFTPHNIEKILNRGIDIVHISIESADPEVFRDMRGADLQKVIEGIKRLVAQKAAKPQVGFAVTLLNKDDPKALPAIIDLYEQLEMDGTINISSLSEQEEYYSIYDSDLKKQITQSKSMPTCHPKDSESQYMLSRLKEINLKASITQNDHLATLFRQWTPQPNDCFMLKNALFVSSDGFVTACCELKDHQKHAFGHIDEGMDTLLQKREKRYKAFVRGNIPEACRKCHAGGVQIANRQ